ncbi:response regulator [Salipiger marinus]|uniref:response regulator n=1 Tax=Salipiger marinus TaxID=555512 RepID=UPI0036383663
MESIHRNRRYSDGLPLRQDSVDLATLDIMLPSTDGLELCHRLRTHCDVPVIFLTALGDETDRIVGLEIKADDYVTKPFNSREVPARVSSLLHRSSLPSATPRKAAAVRRLA